MSFSERFCSWFVSHDRSITAIAFLLPFLLIFWNLGGGSIDLWDESLTAGRSLSLARDFDIFNMRVNGELSLRKPPLMYWLNALSFYVFGINEFALRLPNALFGVGIIVTIAFIANRLYGRSSVPLALLMLCGSPLFFKYSREALTDTVLVFGMTLSLSALLMDIQRGYARRADYLVFALGMMLALSGKGLMALILPAFAVPVLVVLRRNYSALKYVFYTLIGLLPVFGWIIGEILHHPTFMREFFMQEAFERLNYQSKFLPQHIHPLYWYLPQILKGFSVVGLLMLPMAAWVLVLKRNAFAESNATMPQAIRFMAGFVLFLFIVLSCASHKRDAYLLPLLPASILTVVGIVQLYGAKWKSAYGLRFWSAVFVIFIGLVVTARDWKSTPNYHPKEKALAGGLSLLIDANTAVVTDDPKLALLLHFYLQRQIKVANFEAAQGAMYVSRHNFSNAQTMGKYYFAFVGAATK